MGLLIWQLTLARKLLLVHNITVTPKRNIPRVLRATFSNPIPALNPLLFALLPLEMVRSNVNEGLCAGVSAEAGSIITLIAAVYISTRRSAGLRFP
jgi:hypothetical protein